MATQQKAAPKAKAPAAPAQPAQAAKAVKTEKVADKKVVKPAVVAKPARQLNEFEKSVKTAYADVENASAELKGLLKDIPIQDVREIEISSKGKTRKVALIVVPFPALKSIQKLHKKVVPEVEKRVKSPVLIVAKRTIQSKWLKVHRSQIRPRSRTLTAVHEGILEDLITPGTIIAKRIRVRVDGSRILKITLDVADKEFLEDKVEIIQSVYKRLTTKDVVLDFKADPVFHTIRKQ